MELVIFLIVISFFGWLVIKQPASQTVRKQCDCGKYRGTCPSSITITPNGGIRRDSNEIGNCGHFEKHLKQCEELERKLRNKD